MNIKNTKTITKNLFLVISGTLMLSFASAIFIIPFSLVAGGVSGSAIIINKLIGDTVSTDAIITMLTWGLFFVSFFFLGKGFAIKTLVSTLCYPLGITLFSLLVSPDVLDGFFCIADSTHGEIAILPASILSGVLIGTGCSLTFMGGGSTGGVDVVAFILCRKFKKLKHSTAIFYIDAVVIALGMFVIKDLVISIFGISCVLVTAIAIDKIFLSESKAFIAQIISDKYETINKLIIKKLNRTTTVIDIVGGYSNAHKKMLVLSFNMAQYSELMAIINGEDEWAFVTVHRAYEINGEGWSKF